MSFVCRNLLPEPGQKPWQKGFTTFMIGASILGQAYLGLQVYKSFNSKDVEGLSIYSYIALSVGYFFWIFYAGFVTLKMDMPLLLGSCVGLVLAISIIVAIAMYGKDIWKF
jgi:uncharacterized protein with PQ loop repeat